MRIFKLGTEGDSSSVYDLVKFIEARGLDNMLIYELNDIITSKSKPDPEFINRSTPYYEIFQNQNLVDQFAVDDISYAAEINGDWYLTQNTGSNTYLGAGPTSTIFMREYCYKNGIKIQFVGSSLNNWIESLTNSGAILINQKDRPLPNYIINLGKKVSENNLDHIINDFYTAYIKDKKRNNSYLFDLSEIEWISNQELLVLTGLLKYLVEIGISFRVQFLVNGSSDTIDKRKAKQFVQIWEVWKIPQIIPSHEYGKYFDINSNIINSLKKRFNIASTTQEIYERYGVTPFLSLEKIEKYDDRRIGEMLSNIYKLNVATNEILRENNCFLPFENETISSIITKELYENFLDHFKKSVFTNKHNYAFFSISLKKRLDEERHNKSKVQFLLKNNFDDESILELKNFYFDKTKGKYKNESLLQLSFLDFGEGIPTTLKKSYEKSDKKGFSSLSSKKHIDTRVLEYAFRFDSSQHKILDRYNNAFVVPRGLFDLLSIVKRFEGLLVARSNYGKVAFDFSNNNSFSDSTCYFDNEETFFPGTLISIYLPERSLGKKFDYSTIKPNESLIKPSFNSSKKKFISIFDIQNDLNKLALDKNTIYNKLFELLLEKIDSKDGNTLIYLDFKGYEIDERITKKIIFFLSSDYRVNNQTNVVVLNPPSKEILQSIKDEIVSLSEIDKKFKFHPTPFIFFNGIVQELEVFWLGVYSDKDINKLNDLLFGDHDLRASDFDNPDDVVGHINKYDKHGNLVSVINSSEILEYYKKQIEYSERLEIEKIVSPCIIKEADSIYLCNGNYYQYEYLLLFDILSDSNKLNYLAEALFTKLSAKLSKMKDYIFIGITSSSHKIIHSFISKGYLDNENCVLLNNYFSFENEKEFKQRIKSGDKVILVCDVVSTGYMIEKLELSLKRIGAELVNVGVFVDAIDDKFKNKDYSIIKQKLVSIFEHVLKKYQRKDISHKLKTNALRVIRINPFTNTPITQSVASTNYKNSILLDTKEFIDLIDIDQICVGYFYFNNLIHPYFFNMEKILSSPKTSNPLLSLLFSKLENINSLKDLNFIFYPKDSGINNVDFNFLKDHILRNHSIEIIELERFPTNDGWRFSHPPEYITAKSKGKFALILDDGSCSGESLLQMIDQVASLEMGKIVVLSIVGRVNSHKREFFSRINSINHNSENISIKIFFGSHWHVPTYYLSKSPVIDEKDWLEVLCKFPNVPTSIKKIAKGVIEEITPREIKYGNNSHLLKNKNGGDIFNDLILLRDEFGKIAEFIFYKEHFDFFNRFISSYESKKSDDRGEFPYKQIELICAVLLHEPYLFETVKMIVPDVVEKIRDFVNALFWSEKRINLGDLYYHWDNKNLFHLIFIAFEKDQLFSILDSNRMAILINNFVKTSSDLDYILYKFCFYLPLKENNADYFINNGKIRGLINILIENNKLSEVQNRKLKRFRSFLSTLQSSNDDFNSILSNVKHNYDKLVDDKHHTEAMSSLFGILNIQLEELNGEYDSETEKIVRDTFEKITPFINDLLSFSKTYPDFFMSFGEKVYKMLEGQFNSLRIKYGQLSELIYDLKASSNFEEIQKQAQNIYDNYIRSESYYYKIFANISTSNLLSEYELFKSNLHKKYDNIIVKEIINVKDVTIGIPRVLVSDVIFSQIQSNLRHANFNFPIYIEFNLIESNLVFSIKNNALEIESSEHGGGKGISQLYNLNKYPDNLITYSKTEENNIFVQKFNFKIV